MRIPRFLRNKCFWGGAVAGMVAGPWALAKLGSVTGVGVKVPTVGG